MCCQYMGKSRAVAPWAHAVNCGVGGGGNKVTISIQPTEEGKTKRKQQHCEVMLNCQLKMSPERKKKNKNKLGLKNFLILLQCCNFFSIKHS